MGKDYRVCRKVYGHPGLAGIRFKFGYREYKVLPHLDIRRIGPDFYTYSVRAGRADACRSEDPIDSLERCLNDAGDCIGHYFPSVTVSLDGQELGNYSVQRLQQNSTGLAAELLVKAHSPAHMLS